MFPPGVRGAVKASLCSLVLAGCAQAPPRLDVEQQWRKAMGDLGLYALYPPSEDVMVGDVYLSLPDTAGSFDLVRVTSAPAVHLAVQFCHQEEDRLALDSRPRAEIPAEAGRERVPAHAGGDRGNVECPETPPPGRAGRGRPQDPRGDLRRIVPYDVTATRDHLTRLREEAIPILEVGRFTQGEIAGGATSGNLGFGFGAGAASNVALRVELRHLQSATLDELRASRLIEAINLSRLRAVRNRERDFPNALTPLMLARSLQFWDNRNGTDLTDRFCRGDFASLDRRGTRILVANRVLYAGGISYNFLSSDVAAVRATLDFASALANRTQAPRVLELPGAGGQAAAGGVVPPANPPASNRAPAAAAALDNELARTMRLANDMLSLPAGGPGEARARLAVGRFGNLSLDRDFRRPLAVGMGAALQFRLAEAAIPASEQQIEEVREFCRVVAGVDGAGMAALDRRMRHNNAWFAFLDQRRPVVPGQGVGETPVAPFQQREGGDAAAPVPAIQARERLPPLPPGQVRVRR